MTTLLVARTLAPADFASFVGLSAVSVFAAGLWDFGFSSLASREVAAGRARVRTVLSAAAQARSLTFFLWTLAIAGGCLVVSSASPEPLPIVVLGGFAVGSVLVATSMLVLATLRGSLEFGAASFALASGRWLTCGLTALVFVTFGSGHGLMTIAVTVAAGEALTLSIATLFLLRRSRQESAPAPLRPNALTVRAAMPFAANGILAAAYNRLDIIIVASLTSAQHIAGYAPASRIQDVLYLVPSVLGMVTYPVMSRVWNGPDGADLTSKLVSQAVGFGLLIAFPISLLGCIFAPQALDFVLGPGYSAAVAPTRILIWFLPLAVVQAPMLAALGACGRAGDTTRIFAATFVVAICMHLALDPVAGAIGAAAASLSRDIAAVPITIVFAARAGLIRLPHASRAGAQDVVRGAR